MNLVTRCVDEQPTDKRPRFHIVVLRGSSVRVALWLLYALSDDSLTGDRCSRPLPRSVHVPLHPLGLFICQAHCPRHRASYGKASYC